MTLSERKKGGPLITKAMFLTILALAWPTMLQETLETAVQYIDTAMVGRLGTQATAAVGGTTTVNWLVGSTISALGVGFLSFIARAYGAGDSKQAKRVVAQAFLTALVLGVVLTGVPVFLSKKVPVWMQLDPAIRDLAASYFAILYGPMLFRTCNIICATIQRAAGDTRTPMKIGIAVNLINVVLNFFLIYETRGASILGMALTIPGAGLGVKGAALASAIAMSFGGLCNIYAVWQHPQISPKGQSLAPDWEILRPCFRVAIPNMLQRFATSLGYVFFASMINSLGGLSTAAHTIANTVESAFYIPGYGMQMAAATLSGNALGAKDEQKTRELTATIILIEVSLMIVSGGLLFVFAPSMVGIFSKDPAVIALGSTVLRMVAVSEPFYGVSIIIEGLLQGAGETMIPFICSTSTMWLVRIFGTFVCVRFLGLGLVSAWACMITHNMCQFVLLTYFQKRRSSRH